MFDLNGVLCHCEARSSVKMGAKAFEVQDNVFSDRTPTLIGTKNGIFNKMGVLDPPKIILSILVVVKMNLL